MTTWEVVLYLAVHNAVPRIVLIPCCSTEIFESLCRYYSLQFNLSDDLTSYLPVFARDRIQDASTIRDDEAVKMADVVVPVSVRKSGTMDQIIARLDGQSLLSSFLTRYQSRTTPLHVSYTNDYHYNTDLSEISKDFIFHWTRTTYKPWPDEILLDYYGDVVNSLSYPRTAVKTLEHIMECGKLIGSNRHMPGNQRCVSFTVKEPFDFIPLMRWRSRYREMSFEPYGIGIRNSVAIAQKVTYTDSIIDKNDSERWLIQSAGKKGNWTLEAEYRCKGDFIFSKISRDDLLIICPTPGEASWFSEKFGIRVLPMFKQEMKF
jgi:hypothetical protein